MAEEVKQLGEDHEVWLKRFVATLPGATTALGAEIARVTTPRRRLHDIADARIQASWKPSRSSSEIDPANQMGEGSDR